MRRMLPLIPILASMLSGCASEPVEGPDEGSWRQTNSEVHERLAKSALQEGRLADALSSSREALRVEPERKDAVQVMTRALLAGGSHREAESSARRLLELDSESAAGWLLLAESLLAQGHGAAAEQAYAGAAERGSADAVLVLGALHLQAGREAEARQLFRDHGGIRDTRRAELLASHYWLNDRPEQAEAVLWNALEDAPDDPSLWWKMDQVRFAEGHDEQLSSRFDGELEPNTARTLDERLLQAASLLRSGAGQAASQSYRELVAELPEELELRLALGEALLLENDYQGAEAAFEAATRLDRKSRLAYVGMGRSRIEAGRPRQALAPLEAALRIAPGHVPTRSLLVAASIAAGDRPRAEREAREVRMAEPGGPLDHACRRLLERTGRPPADKADETP